MIKNITLDQVQENDKNTDHYYIDYIFGCDVSDNFYEQTGINEDENPRDAFDIWVTKNFDNSMSFTLCNESQDCDYNVPIEIQQQLLNILKTENLIESQLH